MRTEASRRRHRRPARAPAAGSCGSPSGCFARSSSRRRTGAAAQAAGLPVANRNEDDDLNDPVVDPNPGYVGIRRGAKCHANAWPSSGDKHFQACASRSRGMMAPGSPPARAGVAVRTRTSSSNDAAWQRILSGQHAEHAGRARRSESKVGLVYGSSGVADEMYFAWHGGRTV